MVIEHPVLKEVEGQGFKRLYPNSYSQIVELKNKINPHPKNIEEAKTNKFINQQIQKLEEELKNGY